MNPTFKRTSLFLSLSLIASAAHAQHPFEQSEAKEFRHTAEVAAQFMFLAATQGIRGTHSKGSCLNGEFQVSDLSQAPELSDALRAELRKGFFAKPGSFPARIRFANAASKIASDKDYDPRAVSLSLSLPDGKRQDFVLQNSPVFPIPSMKDFALTVKLARMKGDLSSFKDSEKRRLEYILQKAKTFTPNVKSYRTETYWSETAYALGEDAAAKYILAPCASNSAHVPAVVSDDSLRQDLIDSMNSGDRNCFDFRVQILRPDVMTLNGEKIERSRWVEDPTLEWKEAEAPSYSVARLTLGNDGLLSAERCDAKSGTISVTRNTDPANRPIGRINRGREASEAKSAFARSARSAIGGALEAADPRKLFGSSSASAPSAADQPASTAGSLNP